MQVLRQALARGLEPRFAARLRFARPAHRLERGAGLTVGVGKRGFARRKRIGGSLARGFRFLRLRKERAALRQEIVRRVGERRLLAFRFATARLQLADLRQCALAPRVPCRELARDCFTARLACLRVALQRVERGARFARLGARFRRRATRAIEIGGERLRNVGAGQRGFRVIAAAAEFIAVDGEAAFCLFERGEPRRDLRAPALRGGVALARLVEVHARGAVGLARGGFFMREALDVRACSLRGRGSFVCGGTGLGAFAQKILQAIAFGEAAHRRRRRLRRMGEAIPAPEVALARDEALARLQQGMQLLAFAAQHDADLRQSARQNRRRLDVLGKRTDARRQRRVAFGFDECPMRRRGRVGRRF